MTTFLVIASYQVKLMETHRLCWWLTGPLPMTGRKPYCDKWECADAANCREGKKNTYQQSLLGFFSKWLQLQRKHFTVYMSGQIMCVFICSKACNYYSKWTNMLRKNVVHFYSDLFHRHEKHKQHFLFSKIINNEQAVAKMMPMSAT